MTTTTLSNEDMAVRLVSRPCSECDGIGYAYELRVDHDPDCYDQAVCNCNPTTYTARENCWACDGLGYIPW